MNQEQYLKNLEVPIERIDAVLDTDAYNEVDDQYAIAYMIFSKEKINVKAIYAAPFYSADQVINRKAESAGEGMEQSYQEILHILELAGQREISRVFRGSTNYLESEAIPQISPAAQDLAERAKRYSPEKPLYVVGIGCLTNIASALLIAPEIKDNIVIVWLGGNGTDWGNPYGFNMRQDFTASKLVFNCGAPIIQAPGMGVASEFRVTKPELEYWMLGKNKLCDYIAGYTISQAENYAQGKPWSRVLWDVVAVAWLLNDEERFMKTRLIPLPEYIRKDQNDGRLIRYIYWADRDSIFEDLIRKLTNL